MNWIAWFVNTPGSPALEAARRVLRDCQGRGITVELVELSGGEATPALETGAALVVSPAVPPGSIPADQLVLAAPAAVSEPALAVVDCSPGRSAADVALEVTTALEKADFLPQAPEEVYTPEEEERLRKALDDLGYL